MATLTAQKTLVLAGCYEQFRNWVRANNFHLSDYRYIALERELLGYHNVNIEFVGTWYEKGFDERLIRAVQGTTWQPEQH